MSSFEIINADCLEYLRLFVPDNSVDSIVTDPPYGLSFMGKRWDYDVPSVDIWGECLRVLKPGGYLLAFAGTRTQHRMAVRIEDAGFEIRDMIAWVYGSGFPKSRDISKDMDRIAGVQREVIGMRKAPGMAEQNVVQGAQNRTTTQFAEYSKEPITDAARQWQGWGTALKPALEPITVARKPLVGTVAANVLEHGTGALNIDGCRVPTDDDLNGGAYSAERKPSTSEWVKHGGTIHSSTGKDFEQPAGRWPANLIHDGSDEVVAGFPESSVTGKRSDKSKAATVDGTQWLSNNHQSTEYTDHGSAARFFYAAKASKKDRGDGNTHPTVKPTDLMAYLCRLVTPPGGVVLDPFMGSGSTGTAAMREGFRFIGIERDSEYVEIAKGRINAV